MKTIIGVPHLGVTNGFGTQFLYPSLSSDLYALLDGRKVGLELTSESERISLDDIFWKDNPSNVLTLFNPEAKKYFENIEKALQDSGNKNIIYLDDPKSLRKQVEIDKQSREIHHDVNTLSYFFEEDSSGYYEEIVKDLSNKYSIDKNILNSKLDLELWKLYVEALNIDYIKRDEFMLGKILNGLFDKVDVAVVGFGHAYNWMNSGKHSYDLTFLGENTIKNVKLQPLENFKNISPEYNLSLSTFLNAWQAKLLDTHRRQPDYIGLFSPYSMSSYFEIIMDSRTHGTCMDRFGISEVEIHEEHDKFLSKNNFVMKKNYTEHINSKSRDDLPVLTYIGGIDPCNQSRIIGDILNTGSSFVMTANADINGVLNTLEKLYLTKDISDKLLGMSAETRHFPYGIGNAVENVSDINSDFSDDLPF